MQLQTQESAQQINYRRACALWATRYEDWTYPMDALAGAYSQELIDVVAKCLDPNPANRPSPYELSDFYYEFGARNLHGMNDAEEAKLKALAAREL